MLSTTEAPATKEAQCWYIHCKIEPHILSFFSPPCGQGLSLVVSWESPKKPHMGLRLDSCVLASAGSGSACHLYHLVHKPADVAVWSIWPQPHISYTLMGAHGPAQPACHRNWPHLFLIFTHYVDFFWYEQYLVLEFSSCSVFLHSTFLSSRKDWRL